MSVVFIVHGSSGTCPSDAMDWVEGVYASKEEADAFAAANSAPDGPVGGFGNSGPWYEVKEHPVIQQQAS